jgi:hypothetical protein
MAEEKVMEKKAEPKEPKAEAKAEMKAEKPAAAPMKEKPAKKSSAEALMTSEDKGMAPKKEAKSAGKGMKKPKHKHTHVEHHDDGSHTVRHIPNDGDKEVSYAAKDLAGVHAGLDQHVGGMEAPEAPPVADAAAMPPAAAPPAGAMPGQV